MREISPENISGFVTGEGCFYTESGYDPKYRLRHRVRLAFCIELRHDDFEILDAIKKQLGCGNIYTLDFGRYKEYASKKWHPHVKYRVSNFDAIYNKVIPFFKMHPLFGKKQKVFEIFCEIAERMKSKEHLDPVKLETIKALINKLHSLNKKGI